jgi:hypothetical protein
MIHQIFTTTVTLSQVSSNATVTSLLKVQILQVYIQSRTVTQAPKYGGYINYIFGAHLQSFF